MSQDYVPAAEVLAIDGWWSVVRYALADEPRWVEKQLREQVERHRASLASLRFVWLWTSKVLKERGSICAAKVSKVGERERSLLYELAETLEPPHFVVEVNIDEWLDMKGEQRMAVVDHELCHCENSDKGPRIVAHDLQEFRGVVERHGLYSPQLEKMVAAMQLQLPGLDAEGLKGYLARGERELKEALDAVDKLADGTSLKITSGDKSVTMDGAAFERATERLAAMPDEALRQFLDRHDEPEPTDGPEEEAA